MHTLNISTISLNVIERVDWVPASVKSSYRACRADLLWPNGLGHRRTSTRGDTVRFDVVSGTLDRGSLRETNDT